MRHANLELINLHTRRRHDKIEGLALPRASCMNLESIASPQLDHCSLQAGGSDPTRFDWKEAWYPIAYLADLDQTTLTTFTLMERDLVIWWDRQTQSWRVFDDQCPHRLAPLSQGRIAEDGLLECPYHGWAFAGDGHCDRIPQQHADAVAHQSKRACVASLPTAVRQGLLFVYAGQPQNAQNVTVPIVEALDESPSEWVCLNTFRDLPYDALTLLENVLDSSHLSFTHHKSVGNRANAMPVDLEIVESDRQGFRGVWEEGPRRGTLGRQDTTFIAPGLMWHDLTSKQFGRTLTVVYATPIRKGECRLFAIFPFKFSSKFPAFFIKLTPRWYSHINQNAILEDDQIFLHRQERYLENHGGSSNFAKAFYLPTRADRFVTELRQWVNQYQANPFENQALTPALSEESLLDRYHSHTKHCASCRTALAKIQQIQSICLGVGTIGLATIPILPLWLNAPLAAGISGVTILLSGLGWATLDRLKKRFSQGQLIAPRNIVEKRRRPTSQIDPNTK